MTINYHCLPSPNRHPNDTMASHPLITSPCVPLANECSNTHPLSLGPLRLLHVPIHDLRSPSYLPVHGLHRIVSSSRLVTSKSCPAVWYKGGSVCTAVWPQYSRTRLEEIAYSLGLLSKFYTIGIRILQPTILWNLSSRCCERTTDQVVTNCLTNYISLIR